MVKIENDCCHCATEGYPCRNCGARETPHYYCDKCGNDCEELYWYDDKQLCADCILEQLDIVSEDDL